MSLLIEKAMERFRLVQKVEQLERATSDRFAYEEIVGKSRKIQEVFNVIDAIAGTTSTIMIQGESGTGKELVARAIHKRSARANKPFVVINCAAIPEQLLESELFGHKRGSFTGAVADRKGLFEEGNGGTVFLDEIGELTTPLQVKLLRVLQEGEVRSLGDSGVRKVDVRVVAATNRDLQQLVRESKFREDLFYRLNVINVHLPPLRDRPDDIPLLAYHFLEKYCTRMKKKIDRISVDALQALQSYSWTGNVRELENVIERAVVLAGGSAITAQDLPPGLLGESFYLAGNEPPIDFTQLPYQDAKDRALMAFNRAYIGSLLKGAKGNVSVAAQKAGMDRSNFKKLIKRYHVDNTEYRDHEKD
ncbi:MAG: sigma-54-dependent Fis family transcriptional regulator [Deltaproteobacteria bacterium]|nr:sigma-54-dependent Fis family transcriptional regulator [Deltaproteobacteria bacterium]